jgi:hypothetical protein
VPGRSVIPDGQVILVPFEPHLSVVVLRDQLICQFQALP